ncbi:MAG TPA: DUF177 domain-containing protein [Methylocystis sp.]|nr:DUF177 domain-containing protein [Methylocystis sp.]
MTDAEARSFSRPLLVTQVPPEGLETTLRASDAECAALARENGIVSLSGLEARLRATRRGADGLSVSGVLRAKVRQTCVVTLETFDAEVEEPIEVSFAPPAEAPRSHPKAKRADEDDMRFDDLAEDAPDPLIDGKIDLGAIVAEFLTLGLDPYPRRPGAIFVEPAPEGEKEGPFAGLAAKLDHRDT